MSLPIKLRRLAHAEFGDAAEWYERRRVGRGVEFTITVRELLREIAASPNAYPEVRDGVREAILRGFPYAIYYRVVPKGIDVLAVFHASRDPADWQSRI